MADHRPRPVTVPTPSDKTTGTFQQKLCNAIADDSLGNFSLIEEELQAQDPLAWIESWRFDDDQGVLTTSPQAKEYQALDVLTTSPQAKEYQVLGVPTTSPYQLQETVKLQKSHRVGKPKTTKVKSKGTVAGKKPKSTKPRSQNGEAKESVYDLAMLKEIRRIVCPFITIAVSDPGDHVHLWTLIKLLVGALQGSPKISKAKCQARTKNGWPVPAARHFKNGEFMYNIHGDFKGKPGTRMLWLHPWQSKWALDVNVSAMENAKRDDATPEDPKLRNIINALVDHYDEQVSESHLQNYFTADDADAIAQCKTVWILRKHVPVEVEEDRWLRELEVFNRWAKFITSSSGRRTEEFLPELRKAASALVTEP